ncbi:MAG TPA: 30S ribosomal protein S16 [Acidobacteria bacterium]|nr:30S ribosomal protein S16 [Acidobacteriota bacterium]
MLKIRLRREGSRNHPFYRIVVSDSRRTPGGPVVDTIGFYNPRRDPPEVKVDLDSYGHWVGKGAHATPTVKSLAEGVSKAAASSE